MSISDFLGISSNGISRISDNYIMSNGHLWLLESQQYRQILVVEQMVHRLIYCKFRLIVYTYLCVNIIKYSLNSWTLALLLLILITSDGNLEHAMILVVIIEYRQLLIPKGTLASIL